MRYTELNKNKHFQLFDPFYLHYSIFRLFIFKHFLKWVLNCAPYPSEKNSIEGTVLRNYIHFSSEFTSCSRWSFFKNMFRVLATFSETKNCTPSGWSDKTKQLIETSRAKVVRLSSVPFICCQVCIHGRHFVAQVTPIKHKTNLNQTSNFLITIFCHYK